MSEKYSREKFEAVIFGMGFNILQESDGLVFYQKNVYPPIDLTFDWSCGDIPWEDIENQVTYMGMNHHNLKDELDS